MAHLYLIAGHGGIDSGALGYGFQEQERVRVLAHRMKAIGGDYVTLHNTGEDALYNNSLYDGLSNDWQVLELHLNSGGESARGGQICLDIKYIDCPDEFDWRVANFISSYFPGRADKIILPNTPGNQLGNHRKAAAHNLSYRLVECCFITNGEDLRIFNDTMDDVARGLLKCFDIPCGAVPAPAQPPAPAISDDIESLARRVLNGEFGNGDDRRQALGDKYDTVQTRVNEILNNPPEHAIDLRIIAEQVINGDWGNGNERKDRLAAAGYNYWAVQDIVNEMCS